jgi:RNA recognition motif-containing protein
MTEYRTLFLGDLSIHCNEVEIYQLFSQYGRVENVRFKKASKNHNLSYAFVTFQSYQEAEFAIRSLNGIILMGRPLR